MSILLPAPDAWRSRTAGSLTLALLLAAAWLVFAAPAQGATVTLVQRPVEIKVQNRGNWRPLNVAEEVKSGDAVRTGAGGRAELTIDAKRVLRIGEKSEVVLDQLVLGERGMDGKVRLLLGRVWSAILKPLDTGGGESYSVQTPTATMGIKGTRFDVSFDGTTQAMQTTVLEGQVQAKREEAPEGPPTEIAGPREIAPPQQISEGEWMFLVSTNQKLVFTPGAPPQVLPITDEDRADEWVKYNEARDAAMR